MHDVVEMTHEKLVEIVVDLPSDFVPYGQRERATEQTENGPLYPSDCSCGCVFFQPLPGKLGMDWGICSNKASPRNGMLTFEHQGCRQFQSNECDDVVV